VGKDKAMRGPAAIRHLPIASPSLVDHQ